MKISRFFVIIVFFPLLFGCQNKINTKDDNPERTIAREINKRKIVIVSEQPHWHPSGYKEIIKILYEWFDVTKNSDVKSQTLNLVIEREDSLATEINNYFKSSNLSDILNRFSLGECYEHLEFIINLKSFNDSIVVENLNHPGLEINFKVLGFEDVGQNIPLEFLRMTKRESQLWFINKRDSVISQKFIDYYNTRKNDKYLFYYGLAHLQKDRVSKNLGGFIVDSDSCMGYYLAGYLKKYFGDNNVLTIAKLITPPEKLKNMGLDSLVNKTPYVISDEVKNESLNKKQYDYFWFIHYANTLDHIFSMVYSKFIFENALAKLFQYDNYSEGQLAYDQGKMILKNLSYSAGIDFKNINDYKKWFDKQKTFDLSHFDTKEYRDYIFNLFSKEENKEEINYKLLRLGFETNLGDIEMADKKEWDINIWPEAVKNIKFINAIGIFWAGYPDEKVRAKKYLMEFSGEDYALPEKYLQWWRKVYHNYDI
ncbi:MAG: hypothetical protein PHN88_10520 [Ignavibacteria bacterium]|nr:hypothetical protein [Ignavibacteria bacterium]